MKGFSTHLLNLTNLELHGIRGKSNRREWTDATFDFVVQTTLLIIIIKLLNIGPIGGSNNMYIFKNMINL